jgi:hypothetical protein
VVNFLSQLFLLKIMSVWPSLRSSVWTSFSARSTVLSGRRSDRVDDVDLLLLLLIVFGLGILRVKRMPGNPG